MGSDLTPERWRRIEPLLDQALELPPEDRLEWLEEACDDEDLRGEVAALLRDAESATLESPRRSASAALDDLDWRDSDRAGRRLGRWRLIDVLGEGGMGTVWRAERADGEFEQSVAIKLLKVSVAGESSRRRFLHERQILARLEHPGIARLLDGGIADDGIPYLVMELVDGKPLDRWVDAEGPTLDQRLDLFLDVCEAVAFAHRNLVVHRDLKPANILIGADGAPKLLDFGVAKILDEDAVTGETRFLAPLTPEYAAPEQLAGERVTTATDVYALGGVLYRLLTGRAPLDTKGLTAGERLRLAGGETPPSPDAAGDEPVPPEPQAIALQVQRSGPRRVVPPSRTVDPDLARRLRGDLDSIVLQAVREEPEERYASAEQLADDIRRYLGGLPVLAQPPTWPYLLRKLIGRHRKAVATAALLTFSLVAGLAGTSWQAHVAGRERARAETEASRADQVTEYLIGLFETTRPIRVGRSPADVSARELLARGSGAVEELEEEPITQSALLAALGRVYTSLGEYGEARRHLDRALRLAESSEPQPERVAEILHYRGSLHLAEREPFLAEEVLRRAAALRRENRGEESPELARTELLLSRALRAQDRTREALELNNEALASLERGLGKGHPETLSAARARAGLVAETGDLEAAESIYREILERQEELPEAQGLRPPVLNDLAFTLRRQGRPREAEAMYREALAIMDESLGSAHPDTLQVRANLSSALEAQGKIDETAEVLREVVEGAREVFPEGHWRIGSNLVGGLGTFLMKNDRCRDAEPVLREGLAIWREALGPDHSWTHRAEAGLGACLLRQGRIVEGRDLLESGLQGLEEAGADTFDAFDRQKLGQIAEILEGWQLDEASRRLRALLAPAAG